MTGRSLKSLTVLMLDDDPRMRSTVRAMLRALEVGHIGEALDDVRAHRELDRLVPDVLLCNESMHSTDVLDFVHGLRRWTAHPPAGLPVVLLSERGSTARLSAARKAGVTEFLWKPVSTRSLHESIRRAMEARRPSVRVDAYCGPDRRRGRVADRRHEADSAPAFDVRLSDAEIKVLLGN